MLAKPDPRTLEALKRLRTDSDFSEVMAWIEHSTNELDRANRATMDGVVLRMQQGAATVLAEFIERAQGKYQAGAITRPIPAQSGLNG